jgi:RNA polymerase sigma factor (sigma-70 family)
VSATDPHHATHRTIEAVWRIESPRLIATLTRLTRDIARAEDLAQDALVAALEQWPKSGIPDNPGAWLMTTAKHRAIDHIRRNTRLETKLAELAPEIAEKEQAVPDYVTAIDDNVGDDLLRLVFISCHPVLSLEAQLALTLRMLGGLTTDEIARAFLVPEPTIAQRIVRAKRTLTESRVPFEVPRGPDLEARLASVLKVIYLIFNEGYSATAGDDWLRPTLCEEALRLGRILANLVPNEPEAHGLVALMEIQASRAKARVNAAGEPILLLDQNRAHWDQLLIQRGLAALAQAEHLTNTPSSDTSASNKRVVTSAEEQQGQERRNKKDVISTEGQRGQKRGDKKAAISTESTEGQQGQEQRNKKVVISTEGQRDQERGGKNDVISTECPQGRSGETPAFIPDLATTPPPGPYTLQAAIAACHARAATPEATDWHRIAALYATLAETNPSPIIELNRAVAVSMAEGPQAGLDIVDTLTNEPSLKNYHLLPSVRGDLLTKLNRHPEARTEFERAAALTRNTRERNLLLKRAQDCTKSVFSE